VDRWGSGVLGLVLVASMSGCATLHPPCAPSSDPWVQDLNQLVTTIGRRHADPFGEVSREAWEAEARAACGVVGAEDPVGSRLVLHRLVARIGDGHTYLSMHGGQPTWHRFPIWPYWFDGELWILAAAVPNGALAGTRVVRFGGRSPGALMADVAPFFPHSNEAWRRRIGPRIATTVEVLETLGILDADGRLSLEVEGPQGRRTVRVAPDPMGVRPQGHGPELSPERFPAEEGWVTALPVEAPRAAAWQAPDAYYTVAVDDGIVHVKIHVVRNEPGRPFGLFWRREVSPHLRTAEALVVDVRGNGGGDFTVTLPVLASLRGGRLARSGRLFVFTDRATFSAAQMTTHMLADIGAIVVGEEVGDTLSSWYDMGSARLRHSRIPFTWSRGRPLYGPDRGGRLLPDVQAPLTFEAYRSGVDPALQAVRAVLAGPGQDGGRR